MTDEKISAIQAEIQRRLNLHIVKDDPAFAVAIIIEIMFNDFVNKLDITHNHHTAKTEEQNNIQLQRIWKYTEEIFKNKVMQTVKELDERYSEMKKLAPVPPTKSDKPTQKAQFKDKTIAEIKLELKSRLETIAVFSIVGVICLVAGIVIGRL